ncbi:hypothetical protein SUDANB176_02728 [Streptomyces sp. enrichment culture]|uniref:hypothetical protein n=1 Tax=Streptomyces sp. enrichment culture TaxID=1795815 RepID=UPI003F549377
MSRGMKRFAVATWAVLVLAGGGLTLLLDESGPVGWDDWWRDPPDPTSCSLSGHGPSPGAAAEERDAVPWPAPRPPQETAAVSACVHSVAK